MYWKVESGDLGKDGNYPVTERKQTIQRGRRLHKVTRNFNISIFSDAQVLHSNR
jgi:hypothetical protein